MRKKVMQGNELCEGLEARWVTLAGGDRVGVLTIKPPLLSQGRNPGGMVTKNEEKT